MPLSRIFLIEQKSCCGCGCQNCPYDPKHTFGSTKIIDQDSQENVNDKAPNSDSGELF